MRKYASIACSLETPKARIITPLNEPVPPPDLAATILSEFAALVVGKATDALSMTTFTTFDWVNHVYVRNPALWCGGLDLTCVTLEGSAIPTLVSPYHVVMATHLSRSPTHIFKFLDANGNYVTRQAVGRACTLYHDTGVISVTSTFNPDLTMHLLSSPVPSTVTPAKLLPRNYLRYFDTTFSPVSPAGSTVAYPNTRIPCIGFDQLRTAKSLDFYSAFTVDTSDAARSIQSSTTTTGAGSPAYPWRRTGSFVSGDSSSPMLTQLGGETVFLWAITWGGGAGTDIARLNNTMMAMMAALDAAHPGISGGVRPAQVDLSGFKVYNDFTDTNPVWPFLLE